jgi:hypothetical protein
MGPNPPDGGNPPARSRPGTRSAWDPALGVAMGLATLDPKIAGGMIGRRGSGGTGNGLSRGEG